MLPLACFCHTGDLSVTDRVGHEVLSLPLHSGMAPETVDWVCDGVRSYFRKALAA